MRPNFFVNTPDILHAYLQYGGPAAFKIRAVLAATRLARAGASTPATSCSSTSRCEPGSEEYLDSEKYQIRIRDWEQARRRGHARWRRTSRGSTRSVAQHPALQLLRNLTIHTSDDDNVLVFSQEARATTSSSCVVNLDPHGTRETMVHLDMPALGLDWHDSFVAHDEITGEDWSWNQHNYVRLDPGAEPAHILTRQEAPLTDHPSLVPDADGRDTRDRRAQRGARLVPDRGLLRGAGPLVPRLQRRRHRRLQGADREARLPPVARASTACGCRRSSPRRCATAATTSPTTPTSSPSAARSRTSTSSSTSATSATSA